jgi:phasin family protein
MLYNPAEQFAEINKAGVDNALRFAQIALDNAERIINVQLGASKNALEETVKNAKAVSEIKDVQEAIALRAKLAEAGVEKAMSYSRNVYEAASETQAELTKLAEEALSAYTKGITNLVDKAAKSAPAGSDAAVTALKSTVAATTAAIDSFTKASKQVADFADASVKAATQATAAAINKPIVARKVA